MKTLFILAVATLLAAGFACRATMAASASPPLLTVEYVDLNRYVGTWYEIARYPNSFQKGCLGSNAHYALRQDGDIDVVNSCRDVEDGDIRRAKGRAWVVDKASNARLKVSFFWPFRGDYWIIELGKDYEYAVVGTPNRKYLWVLSRTPVMDDEVYAAIMERVRRQGFDPERVIRETRTTRKNGAS
ncbi:lipocalin family protein [Geobacter sulfurreducens subsp. ethanolicus]|uniref:lipocalin family protein n=1 Tax=Geobacter sulfurreducens TaxID=35554 RepID=UPI0025733819|nr:lipocalin family protein [Geobacter sulfurreducens]BEH09700.1 lipocalin family protein [Geobacter sulfurreducens subsp. ethanolicus]